MGNNLVLLKKGLREPHKIPNYVSNQIDRKLENSTLNEPLYQAWLLKRGAKRSPTRPTISDKGEECELKTLKTEREYKAAIEEVRSLGLHSHEFPAKNWDTLSALKKILSKTEESAHVLDAGGSEYSPLIEWLYLYGYTNLYVQNIDFRNDFQRGPIRYQNSDFTNTGFQSSSLDVIICQSVIEHGVPIKNALKEFYRILKPGGILIISTDYWPNKIKTDNKTTSYGESIQEWNIFGEEEIKNIFGISNDTGFETPKNGQLCSEKRPVKWKGESYTFIYFELKK